MTWDETTSDEDLVASAQRSQREAFGLLYDRYQGRVYGYCYRCLGQREAAQDATGDTFRKAFAALPAYRVMPQRGFQSWLFAIAHNVVVDHARARRPALPLVDAERLIDDAPLPEEVAAARAELDSVVALLPRLSVDQRHAIALRLVGLSPAEIGEALGKSRAAVDMILHRALIRLQGLMEIESTPTTGGGRHD
jgi:RNA polymerase sigma-70 factor (ECF subfamily)